MRDTFKRVQWILDIAKRMAEKNGDRQSLNRLDDIVMHGEYGEPGYSTDKDLILTGNWNPKDFNNKEDDLVLRVGNILEKFCELEWEDEWTSCHDCGKLVRTEPDSYSWTASYAVLDECELVCHNCIKEDPIPFLEEMEGDSRKAVTFNINLEDHGYVKVNGNSYENGWYGTEDDPKEIARDLRSKGIERFIFTIDGKGQFNLTFSVWVHESEAGKLEDEEEDDVQ